MKTLLALTKDREDALKALNAATTSAAKGKAAAAFEKATLALAAFNAQLEAKKKAKDSPVDEEEDEEESDDEEEEEDDDSDDEEEEEDDSGDDSDDEDDDDSDDDDDEEEEESAKSRAAALASAESVLVAAKKSKNKELIAAAKAAVEKTKLALAAPRGGKLRAAVAKVTGKKGTRAMLGALEGIAATARGTERLAADVARMKTATRKDRVNAMLASARTEGRIVRDEFEHLRAMGMKDPKSLKAYLSVRPKLVRSVEDGPLQGRTSGGGKDGDAPRVDQIDPQKLSAEQRKIIETAGAGTGLEFDSFVEAMNQTRQKLNGKGKKL